MSEQTSSLWNDYTAANAKGEFPLTKVHHRAKHLREIRAPRMNIILSSGQCQNIFICYIEVEVRTANAATQCMCEGVEEEGGGLGRCTHAQG